MADHLIPEKSSGQPQHHEHALVVDEPSQQPHHGTNNLKTKSMAHSAARLDHDLTLLQALRRYPRAVLWSVLLSTSIIMEGYDIVVMQSFFSQPSFSAKYGRFDPASQTYQIPAPWQSALVDGATVGTIIGAFANGYFTSRFGYRNVLLVSLIAIVGFIFLPFFAPSLPVLLVGQILCGIPWGVFATMAPAYASEICPLPLRGYLAVYVNLCWALGQLVSAGVQAGFAPVDTQWAYRIPFAIQWVWPIPLALVLFFAPESPWHHVRRGEYGEAERNVRRLFASSTGGGEGEEEGEEERNRRRDEEVRNMVAMMAHTDELEREMHDDAKKNSGGGGTSYLDCFRGLNLRRTEIACMAFIAQPFCGSAMAATPTYFFLQAGVDSSISFSLTVGGLGIAAVGTILAWWFMTYVGRRTLYIWGLGLLAADLFVVGTLSAAGGDTDASNMAQASLMLVWLGVYYVTVGPICYAVIAEVSSTRLRSKTICLARIVYYIGQLVTNAIEPFMINPTAANWKGKTAYFWAGWAALFFVWSWFRLPETKGRSFEELDILFAKKIGARKFKETMVDPYEEQDGEMKGALEV